MISTRGWRFIRPDSESSAIGRRVADCVRCAGGCHHRGGFVGGARWLRRLPSLYVCAVLAAGTGMIVARLVRTTWLAALLLTTSGLVYSILTAARAWPSFLLITSNLRYAFFAVTQPDQPLPIIVVPSCMDAGAF